MGATHRRWVADRLDSAVAAGGELSIGLSLFFWVGGRQPLAPQYIRLQCCAIYALTFVRASFAGRFGLARIGQSL